MWSAAGRADRPRTPRRDACTTTSRCIVVVDSQTGEIRQCGNLSGHCIGMNPWLPRSGRAAPVDSMRTGRSDRERARRDRERRTGARSAPAG